MATENKDRITCHVLDTACGKPAANLRIKLIGPLPHGSFSSTFTESVNKSNTSTAIPVSSTSPLPEAIHTFESQTDSDGRVKVWLPYSSSNASGEVPIYTLEDVLGEATRETVGGKEVEGAEGGPKVPQVWCLSFDTAGYYNKADHSDGTQQQFFFPEVNITFTVMPGQRYHVPLLLSPYGYTTYRGS